APPEVQPPTQGRLTALWVMTLAALTVHNIEEWMFDMTGWIATHPWLPFGFLHGDDDQFALALVIVTAAVGLLALVAVTLTPAWSAEVLVCLTYALMINAGSHLLVSLASGGLMPGVITGALLLLPLGTLTVRSLPTVAWTASTVM